MPHIHFTSRQIRAILCFAPTLIALTITAIYIGTGQELRIFYDAYRLEHPTLTLFMTVVTHIGNPLLYLVYAYILWKAWKAGNIEQWQCVKRRMYAYILIQILVSFALTRVLKISFGMPRPDIAGPMTPFTLDHGHHSFPSGHTTEIVGSAMPLAWWAKSFLPSLGIGLYIGLVAYSRIYLSMHHIIDIVAGLLLGSFAAWSIHRLANRKKPMSEQDKNATSDAVTHQVDSDQSATKSSRRFSMGPVVKGITVPTDASTAENTELNTQSTDKQTASEPVQPDEKIVAECASFGVSSSHISESIDEYDKDTISMQPQTEQDSSANTSASVNHSEADELAKAQPEVHNNAQSNASAEPAPFTDPWASDSMDDWAQAQVQAGLTPDGKPDADGYLETWSHGAHNKVYNSTPDMEAFMYTKGQAQHFGAPVADANGDIPNAENTFGQSEQLGQEPDAEMPTDGAAASGVATTSARKFSGFKGFKKSYGPKATANSGAPAAPLEPSLATKAFDFCAQWPIIVLSCLLIMQVIGGIVDSRALWFSDEIRHAAVYENVVGAAMGSADWLILQLNGVPYPDKPAIYFWFLAALDSLPFVDMPMLFMLGTGLSALFMMWATYALARVTGSDRKVAFGAGLVLLTSFYFLGVSHYGRMDLLFAAVITASQICMYQGWRQDKATLWRIMAFVLAAVATLIKGPIGLALPILSAVVFIIWQGKWRRLNTRDGAFAFGLMLCILLSWVTLIWYFNGNDYLRSIFNNQIVQRAVDTWHHKQAWWHYLATLPAAWMPWTLLIFVLPWFAWLRNPLSPILASRHGENLGAAYLWICCITGVAFLSALSGKIVIYLLPLFPMLAILTARGIMRLSNLGSNVLYALFAILFILLGWAFTAMAVFPYAKPFIEIYDTQNLLAQIPLEVMIYIEALEGAGILAAICFLSAIALFAWVDRRQARGALLVTTIFMTILIQPLSVYTAKSLDAIMSPKDQAEVMAAYVEDGYVPMTYRVFPGTYTYYLGANTVDVQHNNWKSLEDTMQGKPKVVLAMRLKDWEEWPNRPAAMHEVHRQWIVNRPFVVVVLDTSPEPIVEIEVPKLQPEIEAGLEDIVLEDIVPEEDIVTPETNPEIETGAPESKSEATPETEPETEPQDATIVL
ncbi:MAG: phosphatase PAP2 family protein [Pseudomonadota bacterium]